MRLTLLILLLGTTSKMYSQLSSGALISLEVENESLSGILLSLNTNYNLHLSFGFDNIPATLKFTFKAKAITLHQLFEMICQHGQLAYVIIDTVIVFKYYKPKKIVRPLPADLVLRTETPVVDSLRHHRKTTIVAVPIPPAVRINSTMMRSSFPSSATTQGIDNSLLNSCKIAFGVFISSSPDFNRFDFTATSLTNQEFVADLNYSLSTGLYAALLPRVTLSLGATWSAKNYKLNYNYQVLDIDDPMPIPGKTIIKANYIEIPLVVEYTILCNKNGRIAVAAGFVTHLLVRQKEHTSYMNTSLVNKTNYYREESKARLVGTSFGIIGLKDVGRRGGLFVYPNYMQTFGKLNSKSMQGSSSVVRINVGLYIHLRHNI